MSGLKWIRELYNWITELSNSNIIPFSSPVDRIREFLIELESSLIQLQSVVNELVCSLIVCLYRELSNCIAELSNWLMSSQINWV